MRIVTFKSVLDRALRRRGLNPAEGVPDSTRIALGEYIDQHARDCWEWAAWPDVCEWHEVALRPVWDETTGYAINSEVYYQTDQRYYRAIQPTTGDYPAANPTIWTEITPDPYLAISDSTFGDLGSVLDVRSADPRRVPRAARIEWVARDSRIYLFARGATTIWILLRQPSPVFTSVDWVSTQTYAPGDAVYYAQTGQCYVATAANSGVIPPNDTAIWNLQLMPRVIADAVVMQSAADLFREDEQFAKADALDEKAIESLISEQDRITLHNTAREP